MTPMASNMNLLEGEVFLPKAFLQTILGFVVKKGMLSTFSMVLWIDCFNGSLFSQSPNKTHHKEPPRISKSSISRSIKSFTALVALVSAADVEPSLNTDTDKIKTHKFYCRAFWKDKFPILVASLANVMRAAVFMIAGFEEQRALPLKDSCSNREATRHTLKSCGRFWWGRGIREGRNFSFKEKHFKLLGGAGATGGMTYP